MLEQQYNLVLKLYNSIDDALNGFNPYVINGQGILSVSISESILSVLPRIEVLLRDVGSLTEVRPILDKMVLSVTMGQRTDDIEDITSLLFNINSFYFNSDVTLNQFTPLILSGYLAGEDMFAPNKNRSFRGSSDEILRRISREVKIPIEIRTTGRENVIWYQDGSNYNFINHVSKRAFISNDGVFFYGTKDGNFVYTSIFTEKAKDLNFTAHYNPDRTEDFVITNKELDIMFYNSYNSLNVKDCYNNIACYGGTYTQYDLVESITREIHNGLGNTDLDNKFKKYSDINTFSLNMGLIGDNSYKNIYRGKVQNEFFKFCLFSTTMLLNINTTTDVKLFDRVNLRLPSTIDRGEDNDVYSGEYYVAGLTYSVGDQNPYRKTALLCRSGINKSPVTDNNEVG